MASDGLKWPRLDVKDLYVDTQGRFKIREAWLDLKELATLDLWGFHFELNRLGIGFEEPRDRLWLDLTGSLRLIEQLPVGSPWRVSASPGLVSLISMVRQVSIRRWPSPINWK